MKNEKVISEAEFEVNHGQATFEKVFSLSLNALKNFIQEVCTLTHNSNFLKHVYIDGNVLKTTENDVPLEIRIQYYDIIIINWFGIYNQPEHGETEMIIKFNPLFNEAFVDKYINSEQDLQDFEDNWRTL